MVSMRCCGSCTAATRPRGAHSRPRTTPPCGCRRPIRATRGASRSAVSLAPIKTAGRHTTSSASPSRAQTAVTRSPPRSAVMPPTWTACCGSARSTRHLNDQATPMCSAASTSSSPKASSELRVPALPGGDARLIALGVGKHPERRSLRIRDQYAARCDGRLDPLTCLVVRYRNVQVDPVALRPRLGHLLEPDRRTLTGRIDDRPGLPLAAWVVYVAKHSAPERQDPGDIQGIDRDLDHLDRSARH